MREPEVSLTLLGKGRGQDGDLLFLQLSDFTLQFGHSLPNCLDLRRISKEAEDISDTLVRPAPRSSGPLPSGRTHRLGCPAWQYLAAPLARLEPHLHRPSCYPPDRAGVIGITCSLRFSSRRNHRLPGFTLLAISHPSRTPNQESSLQRARPAPASPPHPGFSPASTRGSCRAWWPERPVPGPEPKGPQGSKFGSPAPLSHLTPPPSL